MSRLRKLQGRLLLSFVVAIVLAVTASVVTTMNVKPGARVRLRAACLKSLIHVSSIGFTCVDQPVRTPVPKCTGPDSVSDQLRKGVAACSAIIPRGRTRPAARTGASTH